MKTSPALRVENPMIRGAGRRDPEDRARARAGESEVGQAAGGNESRADLAPLRVG